MSNDWRSATFKGLQKVYGPKVAAAAKKAIAENAQMIVDEAKKRCPEDTGRLKASIHGITSKNGEHVDIVADAVADDGTSYARIVEFSPKIDKPFMYPAADATRSKRRENMIETIRKAVRR